MSFNLTLTEELLCPLLDQTSSLWHESWEVGRLVLDPAYRGDQDLLKHCLFLTLEDLCNNAAPQNLFASCSHALSRLYRRFAFTTLYPKIHLRRTEKIYSLIHGTPDVVLAALGNNVFSTHK
jgi:hypothetical protein